MIENLINDKKIDEPVIAQTGYTQYKPKGIKCVPFVTEEEYQRYISEARIIISHAGTGAIFSSIAKGKTVIAIARLSKYGEMVNDHQTEIVKKLSEGGYILDGTYSIMNAWKQLDTFIPRPCDFECTLPQEIEKLIDNWL